MFLISQFLRSTLFLLEWINLQILMGVAPGLHFEDRWVSQDFVSEGLLSTLSHRHPTHLSHSLLGTELSLCGYGGKRKWPPSFPLQAEKVFMVARGLVREAREDLEVHQAKLKEVRDRLDRVSREDNQYLELATLEHRMLQVQAAREAAPPLRAGALAWQVMEGQGGNTH